MLGFNDLGTIEFCLNKEASSLECEMENVDSGTELVGLKMKHEEVLEALEKVRKM